jgi:hypothetical protein
MSNLKAMNLVKTVVGAASTITRLFGIGYLIDCRFNGGDVDKCWLTGGSLAGIATAYKAGYWTPNPGISQAQRNRTAQIDTPEP